MLREPSNYNHPCFLSYLKAFSFTLQVQQLISGGADGINLDSLAQAFKFPLDKFQKKALTHLLGRRFFW